MNNKATRRKARETAKDATILFRKNEINKDTLRIIVASAMAWEMTTSLQEKINTKERKLERRH
jgi:hypothetical protein